MKTCSKCKVTKPVEDFYKDSRKPDGRKYSCRSCAKEYRDANADRNKETTRRWKESNPERVQLQKERQKARFRENPEKYAEKNRKYYQDNKKSISARHRARIVANPEFAREAMARRRAKKGCVVPQRWKKSECPDNLCYWCGVDLSTVKVHLEHLMPISLGGEAKDYNEVAACPSCNLRKNNKHPLVWLAEQF